MKKYLFVAALLSTLAALSVSAQTTAYEDNSYRAHTKEAYKFKHSFELTIGTPSLYDFIDYSYYYDSPVLYGEDYYIYETLYNEGAVISTGSISARYMARLNKWFSMGANITHISHIQNFSYAKTGEHAKTIVESQTSFFPVVRVHWFSTSNVTLYSSFGFGVKFINGDHILDGDISADFTYFGIKVGKKLHGIFEAGVGANGILRAGIGYNF